MNKKVKNFKEFVNESSNFMEEFKDGLKNDPVKLYYEQDNIGKSKYTVNFSFGKHKDGSTFYGINLFNNKKLRDLFIKELISCGYKEK